MKKYSFYIMTAFAALAMQSCDTDLLEDIVGDDNGEKSTFIMQSPSIETVKVTDLDNFTCEEDEGSRANIKSGSDKRLLWNMSDKDKISIFDSKFTNREYTLTSIVDAAKGRGKFKGDCVSETQFLAVFPYSSDYVYNPNDMSIKNLSLPHIYSTQYTTYSDGYTDRTQNNAFVSVCKNGQNNTSIMEFVPICAIVKVSVPNGTNKMSIYANGGEAISGNKITIRWNDATHKPEIVKVEDPYNYIVTSGTIGSNSSTTAKYLYFFVLPGVYSQGISVVAKNSSDNKVAVCYYYSTLTKNSIELEAGKMYDLTEQTSTLAKGSKTPALLNLGSAGIWTSVNVQGMYPTEFAHAFMWADPTLSHTTKAEYPYCIKPSGTWDWDTPNIWTKYTTSANRVAPGYTIDGITLMQDGDDPCVKHWGGLFRTPTVDRVRQTLVKYCTWDSYRMDGSDNAIIGTGPNGNRILVSNGAANFWTRNVVEGGCGASVWHVGPVSVTGYQPGTYPANIAAGDTWANRFWLGGRTRAIYN